MKCLLFYNRNLLFALAVNTIYSTNLNCKKLWWGGITNAKEADGEQHLFSKLKALEKELFERTKRKFKVKMQSKTQ